MRYGRHETPSDWPEVQELGIGENVAATAKLPAHERLQHAINSLDEVCASLDNLVTAINGSENEVHPGHLGPIPTMPLGVFLNEGEDIVLKHRNHLMQRIEDLRGLLL